MKKNITPISSYRIFKRSYLPNELLGEITTLINSDDYCDYVFIANGNIRSVRIGSEDSSIRYGDVLYLLELAKLDIMEVNQ